MRPGSLGLELEVTEPGGVVQAQIEAVGLGRVGVDVSNPEVGDGRNGRYREHRVGSDAGVLRYGREVRAAHQQLRSTGDDLVVDLNRVPVECAVEPRTRYRIEHYAQGPGL